MENIIKILILLLFCNNNINGQNKLNPKIQKIVEEDCILGMQKLSDNSADIIICDPPYNIGKDFGNDSDKQHMDEYLDWCDKWVKECIRILKPTGT